MRAFEWQESRTCKPQNNARETKTRLKKKMETRTRMHGRRPREVREVQMQEKVRGNTHVTEKKLPLSIAQNKEKKNGAFEQGSAPCEGFDWLIVRNETLNENRKAGKKGTDLLFEKA